MKMADFGRPWDGAIDPKISIAGWASRIHQETLGPVIATDDLGFGHDRLLY
jgi:hypothetical protein